MKTSHMLLLVVHKLWSDIYINLLAAEFIDSDCRGPYIEMFVCE